MAIQHFHGKEGEVVWDDRYAPIFTTNNKGKWDPDQLRAWYALSRREMMRAAAEGHKVFFIGDISKAVAPDAVTRKAIADLQSEYDEPFRDKDVWIGQCYVIANPLMRGLVTAVNWMTGGLVAPHFTAPTMIAGYRIAKDCYSKRDLEPPEFPLDYAFPPFESGAE